MINKKVLFVCSRNQWRSPTAEKVWRDYYNLETKSAGTSPNAKKTISINDIKWADLILVMENKHKSRILAKFKQVVKYKKIIVLDIPDNYKFMDKDLIDIFKSISPEHF